MRARVVTALLAVAALCCAAGCGSSIPGTNLPPARYIESVPYFPHLRDYRGVIDCRIKAGAVAQTHLADIARQAQIDFIFLAEPASAAAANYGIGGFTNQILFIPGAWFKAGKRGAEIVGLDLQSQIAAGGTADALIRAIHDQGGLAIAARPARFDSSADYALADAMEVYNQRTEWAAQSPLTLYLRGIFLVSGRFLDDLDVRPAENLKLYDRMASGSSITMVAGMGSAENYSILGDKVGTFAQLFRFYTTHLLAPERSTAQLMAALKAGRAYISFDVLGYVGRFNFFAQVGEQGTIMGASTALSPGLVLKTVLPARADRVSILRNGTAVATAEDASSLAFKPTKPGAYRVEAYRKGLPWILSNPVYLH